MPTLAKAELVNGQFTLLVILSLSLTTLLAVHALPDLNPGADQPPCPVLPKAASAAPMVPTPKATSDVIIIHPLSLVRIANMAQIAVPAGTVEGIDAGDLDVTVQYP